MNNSKFRLKDFVVYGNALYKISTIFYGSAVTYTLNSVYSYEKLYDVPENKLTAWDGKIVTQK